MEKKLLGNSIAREQWLLGEMKIVARLRREGFSDSEIYARVFEGNLFQYPTEKSLRKITRACLKRLEALKSERLEIILLDGPREAAAQVNLYAMMCLYPLVRHFMLDEVAWRYAQFDYAFSDMEINAYFTRLASEYENFATAADSTLSKLKQVLRKCLVECGMLDVQDGKLLPVFLDQDVREAVVAKGDAPALAAFGFWEVC